MHNGGQKMHKLGRSIELLGKCYKVRVREGNMARKLYEEKFSQNRIITSSSSQQRIEEDC